MIQSGDLLERRRARVPFTITNHGIVVDTVLQRGHDLQGRVLMAEGATPLEFTQLSVVLWPTDTAPKLDELDPIRPGANGRFAVLNVRQAAFRLKMTGLSEPYYVKELRVNRSIVPGVVFHFDNGALDNTVDVVLDDKPASLTGVVTEGDRPVPNPAVVCVPWPLNPSEVVFALRTVRGDEAGHFRIGQLAPGDYRLIGGPARLVTQVQRPGELERLLRGGKTLHLTAGAAPVLDIKSAVP